MKHTQGPWSTEQGDGQLHVVSEFGTIAQVGPCNTVDEEDDANARLIAAAPELLAALQELVLAPNKFRPEKYWDAARSAISKATGR